MPLIAPVALPASLLVGVRQHGVIGVGAAHLSRARLGRGGVIGNAEHHRFHALRAGLGDLFDIGHAQRGFDQHVDVDGCITFSGLDLFHQRGNKINIGR